MNLWGKNSFSQCKWLDDCNFLYLNIMSAVHNYSADRKPKPLRCCLEDLCGNQFPYPCVISLFHRFWILLIVIKNSKLFESKRISCVSLNLEFFVVVLLILSLIVPFYITSTFKHCMFYMIFLLRVSNKCHFFIPTLHVINILIFMICRYLVYFQSFGNFFIRFCWCFLWF